jgi:hypothetical protein
MTEYFAVVNPAASPDDVRAWLAAAGGRSVQSYGDRAMVVDLPERLATGPSEAPGIVTIYDGPVPDELGGLDEVARMGVAAWNLRQSEGFQESRRARIGEGRSWGGEGTDPEG